MFSSEADPQSGWSTPLEMNADVQYAATLVRTILLHWNAKFNRTMSNLMEISHDNAFLSYHPYEFTQRTLLARFQMNLTNSTQFFHKPVYSALGLLANLAPTASKVFEESGLTYLITKDDSYPFYAALVVVADISFLEIEIPISIKSFGYRNETIVCFVEAIKNKLTDPYYVWKSFGAPAYPNVTVRDEMRRVQVCSIF